MGNIINWFKNLELFVSNRRADRHTFHRSAPDHPERTPVDRLTTNNEIEQNSESSSVSTAPKVELTIKCSDFYWACRDNNIDDLKRFLETILPEDIDRVEPNGSTALHTACYHGHGEIVKLLLIAGADRAIPNKYNYLPFDEANDEIRQFFYRIPTCNRFISNTGSIEWELIDDDDDVSEKASEERDMIKSLYDTVSHQKMFERIEKNYIGKGMANFNGIENIKRFFKRATEEQDPIWIIKAYTAETDFYKTLNTEIASGASVCQLERKYIIALLLYHPKLDELSYIGISYRVMQMNEDNIKKYQVNCLFMTKSFLSSSIDEKIAAWFLCRHELAREDINHFDRLTIDGKVIKQWVMCKYQIKHQRTALHIENTSQYVSEGEVLIMPYSVFKVKQIQQIKTSYLPDDQLITEIQLEECDHTKDKKGLTDEEVNNRHKKFGHNRVDYIEEKSSSGKFVRLLWNRYSCSMELTVVIAIIRANGSSQQPNWKDFLGTLLIFLTNSILSFVLQYKTVSDSGSNVNT